MKGEVKTKAWCFINFIWFKTTLNNSHAPRMCGKTDIQKGKSLSVHENSLILFPFQIFERNDKETKQEKFQR